MQLTFVKSELAFLKALLVCNDSVKALYLSTCSYSCSELPTGQPLMTTELRSYGIRVIPESAVL